MKPVQLIAILGGLLIVAVIGWYLYMESNPPYETTPVRGLDLPAVGAKQAAPSSGAAAPTEAPPSQAAPSEAAPSEAAPSEAAPTDAP